MTAGLADRARRVLDRLDGWWRQPSGLDLGWCTGVELDAILHVLARRGAIQVHRRDQGFWSKSPSHCRVRQTPVADRRGAPHG